jgi:hypothetical protein
MMAGYDTGTLTVASTSSSRREINVAQHDILRLTTPGAALLGGPLEMDAFDHDLTFETDGLLCVPSIHLRRFRVTS